MRTRLIVIGAFLCATILPAALAASVYTQARHVPCLWSADYCGLLNNVLSDGAVFRGCAIVSLIQGATLITLDFKRWREHEQINWPSKYIDVVLLLLFVALAWGLSQAALDAYGYFYSTVPAGAPHDAQIVVDFNKRLDKAMLDSANLAAFFIWATGLEMAICIYMLWKAFESEELEHEIAVHEVHRRHEYPESADQRPRVTSSQRASHPIVPSVGDGTPTPATRSANSAILDLPAARRRPMGSTRY